MSTLEVNNIKDTGSNSLISSNGSGTFTINNDVLKATPAFLAVQGSDQSISNNTITKAQINTEEFDTDGCYDNSTNYRFTPTTAGKYLCFAQLNIGNGVTNDICHVYLYKNGSMAKQSFDRFPSTGDIAVTCTGIISFNGTTDYLEMYARQNTGASRSLYSQNSFFGAYKLIGV